MLGNYFNHPFFNTDINIFPEFNFQCEIHCSNCKCNICELCLNKHLSNNPH